MTSDSNHSDSSHPVDGPTESQARTLNETTGSPALPGSDAAQMPKKLGRYTIIRLLGTGGFAHVFLAHDDQLDREVAIKVHRSDRNLDEGSLGRIADEAKMIARLQHPGIVTVFDVGTHEGLPFIVMAYIRGRSLAHLMEHENLSFQKTAQLCTEIATALAHAHANGFFHRDVKPQNILLDGEDRPHVADFGLAMRHDRSDSVSDHVVGTTHYMAPEQVRGENHRIDGRTDIWALGVIMYRMLTGKLPFTGSSAPRVYQQILYGEFIPPIQVLPAIGEELDRICTRCLCRQMSERYRSATDLADDLREWSHWQTGGSGISGGSSVRRRSVAIEPLDVPVIPRGLRSFGEEDGDFFLKLMPGPRDRNGLPVALQFWKQRIEETDSEETFRVGLLYGPSGCGKSSLVKAGLIPRLSSKIVCLYVDTTAGTTEARLVRSLRRAFPELPASDDLSENLRVLRERPDLRQHRKVLIAFDQFEQWLQAWHLRADAELVRGLLQCDGGSVQCLLMVRDDFWLPVSRLMRQLDMGIVEGENGMLVDSFDLTHARKVLRLLGVAYGRLPEAASEQTAEQNVFLELATEGLAEDNRLYPVRLAVFVEMVKDRKWIPATLEQMGGTEGVGVAFLEHSVGSLSSPARRIHERAARHLLAELLPQAGQLKGPVRSRTELLEATDYGDRPRDFAELMHLLDVELRLISPSKSADDMSESSQSDAAASGEASYQLTHDFLVPSIREWLDRQLRGSRRGRARLLLQEQAELWNSRPSSRYLPTFTEWLGLRLLTRPRQWTPPQKRMMDAAGRRIFRQTVTVAAIVLLSLGAFLIQRQRIEQRRMLREAGVLLSQLQDVDMDDVPSLVEKMVPHRTWINRRLETIVEDDSASDNERVRAAIALLPETDRHVAWLTDQMIDEQLLPSHFLTVREALAAYSDQVAAHLRTHVLDETQTPQIRFRAACALARFDANAEIWKRIADEVALSLLHEPAADAPIWIAALSPVAEFVQRPLTHQFAQTSTLESARIGALAINELDDESPAALARLLEHAQGQQYRSILEILLRQSDQAMLLASQRLDALAAEETASAKIDEVAHVKANLILACFELGNQMPFRQAAQLQADPRVRTRLIHGMNPVRMDLAKFIPVILDPGEYDACQNVAMLAAWRHLDQAINAVLQDRLVDKLVDIYREDPDRETHAAAGLLLRSIDEALLDQVDGELQQLGYDDSREWFVNAAGKTMVILDPGNLEIDDYQPPRNLDGRFAISDTEITFQEFKTYWPPHVQERSLRVDANDVPAAGIYPVQMAKYCNYLSELDRIDEDEWCYPTEKGTSNSLGYPLVGYLQKRGYRLPTNLEWQFACRGGTSLARFFGDDLELLKFYAWDRIQSERILQRVGSRLPNQFGLFDMLGNAAETCIPVGNERAYVSRGASCQRAPGEINAVAESPYDGRILKQFQGFRVVRRLPPVAKESIGKHGESD